MRVHTVQAACGLADDGRSSLAALQAIHAGLRITVVSAGTSTYCISNTQGNVTYYKNGPGAAITATACT